MEVGRAEARTQIYGLIVLKEHIDSGWKLEERSCGDKWLDSEFILKVEATGFTLGQMYVTEKKRSHM